LIGHLTEKQLYWASGIFILIAGVAIAFEFFYLLALPFAMLMLYFLFTRIDAVMWVVLFLTPLSITLTNEEFNLGLSLPTEPLLALVTAVILFQSFFGNGLEKRILKNPITLAIAIYLGWMLVTVFTSALPVVSMKYFIARTWFIIPYYLVMVFVLNSPRKRELFFWVFLIPLVGVALYTLYVHSQYSFSKDTSVWVMYPFFKEHTSWGAVLAMYFPVSAYFALRKGDWGIKSIAWFLFVALTIALIFSYTRAAWVSLIAAAGVWVIVKFKIKWPVIAMGVITVLLMVIWNWGLIMDQFEQNTTVSSDDLGEHVTSISNVSTDASNMERINRWKSALRMFEERPILGWGPGTYMFLYAPYQKPWEKTIISTNAGNRGNAHSEYIGPLAESGIPGLVTVLLLVITVFTYGMRVYRQTVNYNQKELVLMALLGLTTYFTHGVLNNFLDMDKASAPFWGFIALLVAQDFWNKRASISEVYL
jgi:putative inorganic carbon (HCO3(-)) transporter